VRTEARLTGVRETLTKPAAKSELVVRVSSRRCLRGMGGARFLVATCMPSWLHRREIID
jgi:hypothetical protein